MVELIRQGLPQETIDKILEAHANKMSIKKAMNFAGASNYAVRKYWREAGLKCHFGSTPALSEEQIEKVLIAHADNTSASKVAESVGVNEWTVRKYWKKAGLKCHFDKDVALSGERKARIFEAHRLRMSIAKAAEYSGTATSTVIKYWKQEGLEPYNLKHYKIRITDLLDAVFDTKRNPGEELTFGQIKSRLEDRLDLFPEQINEDDLRGKVRGLVQVGFYNSSFRYYGAEEIEVYSAGMPKAMGSNVNK